MRNPVADRDSYGNVNADGDAYADQHTDPDQYAYGIANSDGDRRSYGYTLVARIPDPDADSDGRLDDYPNGNFDRDG